MRDGNPLLRVLEDPLTGLPSRPLFFDSLGDALTRAERVGRQVAVLFLDLDRFKLVNDSLGHAAGDRLLVAVARRLRQATRATDTIARFGGDEFTVLSEGIEDVSQATAIAERLALALAAPFFLGDRQVAVTASVGIAVSRGSGETPETLLRDADTAMYRAKALGKARHAVFEEGMRIRVLDDLTTESDLHGALERGELELFYQPTIRLDTGQVVGMEALVRWRHPRRGLVEPAEFVPLAEETGLIVPLGSWVLTEACRQARLMAEAAPGGRPPWMSVNLSARQLADDAIVGAVGEAIGAAGIDPGLLSLEVTESVLMGDAEAALAALGALRGLGVRMAVDDFGTGYSSLSYLKRMPVDTLKIDRAFIEGLGQDVDDFAIVSAVVSMAWALGLDVVAEGVEHAGQLAVLRTLGCGYGQGFWFARPQSSGDVADLLQRESWSLVSG